jgi:hypothetical protein
MTEKHTFGLFTSPSNFKDLKRSTPSDSDHCFGIYFEFGACLMVGAWDLEFHRKGFQGWKGFQILAQPSKREKGGSYEGCMGKNIKG